MQECSGQLDFELTAREEGREDAGAERVGAAEIRVALAQGEDEVDVLEELDLVEVGGEGEELREEFEVVGGLDCDDDERAGLVGASLQAVWHGAAPCPPSWKREMIEWFGPRVHEYYGSTEGAFISTIEGSDSDDEEVETRILATFRTLGWFGSDEDGEYRL